MPLKSLRWLCPKFPTSITKAIARSAFRLHLSFASYSGMVSTGIPSQFTAKDANTFHSVIIPAFLSLSSNILWSISLRYVHNNRHQSQICRNPIPSKKK